PAVVVAAQAALLRDAVAEIGAPVRAVTVEQAVAAARVPVENEVLAHETHGQRRMLVELRDGGDGLPVAAHQLAHRRAAADAREPLVLLRAQHGRARRMIPSLPDRNRRRCAMRRHRPVAGSLVAALLTLGLVDPLTVRFHLKEPWPDFMTFYGTTATAAGIVVPKKYLTQVGEDAFRRHPIGAGPYRYVSHTPGVDVVLEAYTGHWRRVPSVKRLIMKSVS